MQKIRIIHNGGISEAKWGRMIERTSRDRPGGHHSKMIHDSFGGQKTYFGQKGRKATKSLFAKQARREHARITEEAVREWISDRQDVWENFLLYGCDEAREWHEDWQAEQEQQFWNYWDNWDDDCYYYPKKEEEYLYEEPYDYWYEYDWDY